MKFTPVNPATGELLQVFPGATPGEVRRKLESSQAAFLEWRNSPFPERARCLRNAAQDLRRNAADYARLMAEEMGKPVSAGRSEVEKCAWVCEHYAEHGAQLLADQPVTTEAVRSFVCYRPLGVILAVMPWNFPFWQVFRFAAPTLMAGNAALLKHAPNVPGCALALGEIMRRAEFPEGLFQTLLIPEEEVAGLIEDPRVRAVTLTGSVRAGREVARKAGEMLKKTVLELGGSDPYVVLADADVDHAAKVCAQSRLVNSGQSCIAAKRLIVVEAQLREFEEKIVAALAAAEVGDPNREETEVGPLARADLRDHLHRQVAESVARGARLLLGGAIPEGQGFFYPPTVLTNVTTGMPAYAEELFGPVAAIIPVANDREALLVANDSAYGLGAAVFTRDTAYGSRLAVEEMDAGCCFVNGMVRSDPRLPFGGVKQSGYGRELAVYGIREFVNVKTVWEDPLPTP